MAQGPSHNLEKYPWTQARFVVIYTKHIKTIAGKCFCESQEQEIWNISDVSFKPVRLFCTWHLLRSFSADARLSPLASLCLLLACRVLHTLEFWLQHSSGESPSLFFRLTSAPRNRNNLWLVQIWDVLCWEAKYRHQLDLRIDSFLIQACVFPYATAICHRLQSLLIKKKKKSFFSWFMVTFNAVKHPVYKLVLFTVYAITAINKSYI